MGGGGRGRLFGARGEGFKGGMDEGGKWGIRRGIRAFWEGGCVRKLGQQGGIKGLRREGGGKEDLLEGGRGGGVKGDGRERLGFR